MKYVYLKFLLISILLFNVKGNVFGNDSIGSQNTDNFIEIHKEVIKEICKFLPETLIIKSDINKNKKMIFSNMVICSLSTVDTSCILLACNKFGFTEKDINQFVAININPSNLIIPDDLHNLIILNRRRYRSLDWDSLNIKFPNTAGFCGYSQISLSSDSSKAIIYFFRQYGSESGGGYYMLFDKINGKWKRKDIFQTWKS